jgi:acetyl-CoA carboxylase biotin carboxyl carrier protein
VKPASVSKPPGAATNGLTGQERTDILELVELLKQHDLAELEFERGGFRVRLRRDAGHVPHTPQPREITVSVGPEVQPESPALPAAGHQAGLVTVTSPIVGTFYRSPSPDADPYVEEGDLVKKGQVLCIVEAMKLMNEIESEADGRIVKILAESTKPVEYGQPLFLIDPAHAS